MRRRDPQWEIMLRWVTAVLFTLSPTLFGIMMIAAQIGSVLFRTVAISSGLYLSFGILFIFAPYVAPDRRYFIKGRKAFVNQNVDEAIFYLEKAIRVRQRFYFARLLLAMCLSVKGKYRRAIRVLNRAIEVKSRHAPAYIVRGSAKLQIGDHEGALADANKAIQLNRLYPQPYELLASIYHDQCDYSEAIAQAKRSLELGTRNPVTPSLLGKMYLELCQYTDAADAFDMALEFDFDQNGELFLNRAKALYYLGDFELALDDLNDAVNRLPSSTRAYFERGLVHLKLKQYQAAKADYDMVIQLNPDDFASYVNRGLASYFLDDYDKAKTDYAQALALQENGTAYINWGSIKLIEGDYPSAITHFEKGLALSPHLKVGVAGLAVAHYLQGDTEKAREIWAGLVKDEPRFQEVEWVIEEHGQHPKMAALIRRFFEAGPITDAPKS